MARLDQLPLELLILTAQSLHNQKDISALVRTNKTLHHALYAFLCRFNVEHHRSSALLWAARNGYTDLVTRMLDAGANISSYESPTEATYDPDNLVDLSEVNPLLAAAQGGHLGTLRAMLSEKRPGRASSPAQLRTVFHWAIRSRTSDLVELMIENNAPLDPAGKHHMALSALSVAIDSGNNSIIPRLLELGARSGFYESPCPVELAICTDQPQLVELLLKHGMQPHDNEGLGHIIRRNDKALLQLLLDYGLKLKFYFEPLFIAIMEGQYEMVEMLIDNGVNPNLTHSLNTRDEEGYDEIYNLGPVGFAIHFRHLDILKLLLDKDVPPGRSDMQLAAERKYEEAMVLLSKFADQELHDRIGAIDLWMTEQVWNVLDDPDFRMPATSYEIEDPITPPTGRQKGYCLNSFIL
ncbi:ankyrin repeat protein [Aspergillus pseudonomiae]|nr:ankyrin repeat protein [Aspergillus pseudonomiae]